MDLKHELQTIISGIGSHPAKGFIEAATYYLGESQKTGGGIEKPEFTKEQEAARLTDWATRQNCWLTGHDEGRYLARGAEQRVYLHTDERYVYKLNDAVFYLSWIDYFHSILVHNYFFPQTAYECTGFYRENETLYAVVKQPYIEITEPTDLHAVSQFLNENGFELIRNNDYINRKLGIVLEDLHDENVLTNNGVLFFVDTVFYLQKDFYKMDA